MRICPLCNSPTEAPLCASDGTATIRILHEPPAGLPRDGDVINGRYRIEQTIGSGGFGAVYRVVHTGTGQPCALKVLAFTGERHEQAARRFFAEARVTAGLKHNNTVRVFDFGQDDRGWPYLAMELLVGHTLAEWMGRRRRHRKPMTQGEAVQIGVSVLRSLIEAHDAGLVHRDLKPPNIFLHELAGDEPVIKVLDFGIAKSAEFALTQGHQALGTPMYMSPEQCMSEPVDGRSDLYSLACILFNMVCGRPPFGGESVGAIVLKQIGALVPDVAQLAQSPLTPEFAAVVTRALQKDPADRFANAAEMRDALKACAQPDAVDWRWEMGAADAASDSDLDVLATTGWQGVVVDRKQLAATIAEPRSRSAQVATPDLPDALPAAQGDTVAPVGLTRAAGATKPPTTARYAPLGDALGRTFPAVQATAGGLAESQSSITPTPLQPTAALDPPGAYVTGSLPPANASLAPAAPMATGGGRPALLIAATVGALVAGVLVLGLGRRDPAPQSPAELVPAVLAPAPAAGVAAPEANALVAPPPPPAAAAAATPVMADLAPTPAAAHTSTAVPAAAEATAPARIRKPTGRPMAVPKGDKPAEPAAAKEDRL